jgi:hypothetical protein
VAYVRTFEGYRPAPRSDGVKWTTLAIYEAASSEGPWTVPIDTQPIANYADAANPPDLSFTTDDAQLEAGWYRVQFRDAGAGVSWTTPEAFGTTAVLLPPAAGQIRGRSPYLRATFPTSAPAETQEDLRQAVLDATSLVESLTCRSLQTSLGDAQLDRLAFRAVQLKTERIMQAEGTARARAGALGNTRLKSISAGPWSETYFGPEEAGKAKVLDLDPTLNEVLWALATPECRANWTALWGGAAVPAVAVAAFRYGAPRGGWLG